MSEGHKDMWDQIGAASAAKAPKNPKSSARAKYNRRKTELAHALEQMEIAIAHLQEQPGATYKAKEVETLKAAIGTFRDTTGLIVKELAPLTQGQMDHIMDMLTNGKPWEPPSDEVMAELRAALEMAKAEGLGVERPNEDEVDIEDGC